MLGKRRRAHGHSASAAPRKKRRGPVLEEITFDADARKEFLTGFHRRKVARQKRAQEVAAQKEKEERRQQRAQVRAERQEYLRQHAAAMQAVEGGAVNEAGEDEDGESGTAEAQPAADTEVRARGSRYSRNIDAEREYENDEDDTDDDLAATVTIEAVDVTRDGLRRRGEADAEVLGVAADSGPADGARVVAVKDKTKPKKKRKKQFRYESKAERQATVFKERASSKARRKGRQKE